MIRGASRWRPIVILAMIGLVIASGLNEPRPRDVDDGSGLPQLVHLAAGTKVDGPTADGQGQRVIRSVPRLASGDIASLGASSRDTATLFRSVILADVEATDRGHRLRRISVATAVPFEGREVVVTADGPADVRASLGILGRLVANAADTQVNRGRIVARTPTFALYLTPGKLLVDGHHKVVDLHYAILADPATGRVETITWDSPEGSSEVPRRLSLLDPDATFDCAFDVAVTTRVGPIAIAWSFAMNAVPSGQPVEVPTSLRPTIADVSDPVAMERAFRSLVP